MSGEEVSANGQSQQQLELQQQLEVEQLNDTELLVCGGIAGGVAKTVTAPLDRIRLLYLINPSAPFTVRTAADLASDIARRAGAEGLWRGHTATLWRVIPFAGVQFWVYDEAYREVALHPAFSGALAAAGACPVGAAAGAIAATTATVVTYPLDVLRTRMVMEVDPVPKYRNYLSAVEAVIHAEGFRGFYRGLHVTLLGVLPYGALSFGAFEALKEQLRNHYAVSTDSQLPLSARLAAGGVGAAFAQVAVHPLHVVRRRMQSSVHSELFRALDKDQSGKLSRNEVEPLARRLGVSGDELWRRMDTDKSGQVCYSEFKQYTSTRDALQRIRGTEGVAGGLYKAVSLTWVKGPLTVGLALAGNDNLKAAVRRQYSLADGDQYTPLAGRVDQAASSPSSASSASSSSSSASGAAAGQRQRPVKAIESLVCGGIAGGIAKTVIAPGDRIKIMFQTDPSRRYSPAKALRLGAEIVNAEGARALWRGHAATLLRVVPYSATMFAVFEPYKASIREATAYGEATVRFLAGAAAGMTATSLTYPLDVFRARMAARAGPEAAYDGYARALREVVRTEGAASLLGGLRPTLLGVVPYAGLSFCIFETFKARLREARGGSETMQTYERLAAGGVAGLLAQSCTYPLDVIRRRMQVNPEIWRNEWQVFQGILRSEGVFGFYKGLSMNWVKGPLAISISYCVNDTLRELLARQ